ncbi:MAG: hypothetical protein GY847_25890 [Proteobacteria bacterium]|nr:hypothetical protein [Pseudomonadota bacterium]
MGFEFNIGSERTRKPLTVGGFIIGVIAVVIFIGEFFLLKGDLVASDSIHFNQNSGQMQIEISELPGDLLVQIRSGTKKRQVKLAIKLQGPEGETLHEKNESFKHHGSRYFTFTPEQVGVYQLQVNGEKGWMESDSGAAHIEVFANDKRFFWRLTGNKL